MFIAVVRLADPSGAVEEKRKPSDPGPELDPANRLDPSRQMKSSVKEHGEHREDGFLLRTWC